MKPYILPQSSLSLLRDLPFITANGSKVQGRTQNPQNPQNQDWTLFFSLTVPVLHLCCHVVDILSSFMFTSL